MLSINNLNLQYGRKHLFRDVSVQVHDGERIGLAGVNGAGKSTLLKIMAGEMETDPGIVSRASWFTVAYLPQEITIELTSRSLYEEAETAFADVLAFQQEMEQIGEQLATLPPDDPEVDRLLARQGELQQHLEGRDVFRIRPQIERILFGLGFSAADLDKEVASFSGGWIMRLLLAKLLLRKPSLLLLDEPTNHLDIESLTWLEEFLLQYDGAMVIISHDRSFLDRVTSITWELSLGRLTVYKGNYSHYLVEKQQRLELERAAYENQQAKIRQTERFIERFRSKATKARQVQSRIKQLEKMERIELSETDRSIRFSFPPAAPSGRDVLTLKGVRKTFGDRVVLDGLDLHLQRGDKLAVVGVNGAGKTTLLKILAGVEDAEGTIRMGHNVILSYFGQHQAQELPGELSVLDTVYHGAEEMTITQVRSLLGAFLFSGDEVEKKVKVLSGGEKSRVALAKMLVRPANLMLLDEPTNHLDISSQEVLQEAMAQYEGTIIVVSHNRYFTNSFVNKVLEIRDGRATLYQGNIDDYLARRKKEEEKQHSPQSRDRNADSEGKGTAVADKKALRRQRAQLRQEMNRKLGPLKKQVKTAEQEIEKLEERKAELEQLMADPELYSDSQRWSETSREYNALERRLERWYGKWEEAQEKIEALEEKVEV
ncbi:ABC transporter ATP-binding protein [Desulfolithobacter dissulfuricans]|uniref:ABC transporter ATP-binding protein n=1 Tax=Desulfolithobacter dissulfuricans TaxID=2795293 RepID=A0A915XIS6_9BACT|nr:ABC-F family ATP-binding cassette domain-containing protein [Desulfolithobacter dissulfuricans]BCO07917.1 ABC transporter ATP-binding protein [Desulfolithobacter dissulfuricans]